MYAVVKTGGKQYRLAAGERVKVEMLPAEVGASVNLEEVLAVGAGDALTVGTPLVAGARVETTVVSQGRADKVRIFKHRRRKHYAKRQGHRQYYTELLVNSIIGADGAALATAEAPAA